MDFENWYEIWYVLFHDLSFQSWILREKTVIVQDFIQGDRIYTRIYGWQTCKYASHLFVIRYAIEYSCRQATGLKGTYLSFVADTEYES